MGACCTDSIQNEGEQDLILENRYPDETTGNPDQIDAVAAKNTEKQCATKSVENQPKGSSKAKTLSRGAKGARNSMQESDSPQEFALLQKSLDGTENQVQQISQVKQGRSQNQLSSLSDAKYTKPFSGKLPAELPDIRSCEIYNAQVSQHPLLIKRLPDGCYHSYQDVFTIFDLGQYQSKVGSDAEPEIIRACVGVPKQFAVESGKKDLVFGNSAIGKKAIVDLEWPIDDDRQVEEFVQYVLDNIKQPLSSMTFVCPCRDLELRQMLADLTFSKYDAVQNIAFIDQLRASVYEQGKTNGLVLNFGGTSTAGIVYEDFVLERYTRSCSGCFWWNAEVKKHIQNETQLSVGPTQIEALQKQLLVQNGNQFNKFELPDGQILKFSASLRDRIKETNSRFQNLCEMLLNSVVNKIEDENLKAFCKENKIESGGFLLNSHLTAYNGARLVYNLDQFQNQTLSRAQYDEFGSNSVERWFGAK